MRVINMSLDLDTKKTILESVLRVITGVCIGLFLIRLKAPVMIYLDYSIWCITALLMCLFYVLIILKMLPQHISNSFYKNMENLNKIEEIVYKNAYQLSKDYDRLKYLLDNHYEIVCFVNYRNLKRKDVCRAKKVPHYRGVDYYQLTARGISYFCVEGDNFTHFCKFDDVEFIDIIDVPIVE